MLKRLFYLILGFLLGASSILYIYGDMNKVGVLNLYSKYKETKQKQKDEEDKLVRNYIQKSLEVSKEVNVEKKPTKSEKNKWKNKIKHEPYFKYNLDDYSDLYGNKVSETFKKNIIVVGFPYDNTYGILNNKSPKEYARLQEKNLKNILKVKELLSNNVEYRLSVSKKMYIEDFNSNPAKLISYINEKYPNIDFPIYIDNNISGFNDILSGTINFNYLIDENFDDNYMEQLIYLINNNNYDNENLFPPKEYIMSTKMSKEAIEYYEKIRNAKFSKSELLKNENTKPKIIGFNKNSLGKQ
ncbi:hypothetical protein [Oceanivirga miroungae]|uniref:Uncharacterized protein n=1 Tax=Oceanivirga miroungae TaxID=1130046 RepID=A0A6I8MD02_9FUSO|nr:hypothetical protein [Oceanivirga miroungae]VWL84978.1 hypothetical protein OMES3154_00250 [Oceanivirga miroungae]